MDKNDEDAIRRVEAEVHESVNPKKKEPEDVDHDFYVDPLVQDDKMEEKRARENAEREIAALEAAQTKDPTEKQKLNLKAGKPLDDPDDDTLLETPATPDMNVQGFFSNDETKTPGKFWTSTAGKVLTVVIAILSIPLLIVLVRLLMSL